MNRVVVLAAAILLASLTVTMAVPGLSSAQVGQDEPSAPLEVLTEEEALAKDAGWYADRYGVPLEEAIRRLKLQ